MPNNILTNIYLFTDDTKLFKEITTYYNAEKPFHF